METKRQENSLKSICRVCLNFSISEQMVSLIDGSCSNGLSCFGQSVLVFANIELINESLPVLMCESCLIALKNAIKFKLTCESSHKILQQLYNEKSVKSFQEKLINYVDVKNQISKHSSSSFLSEIQHNSNENESGNDTDSVINSFDEFSNEISSPLESNVVNTELCLEELETSGLELMKTNSNTIPTNGLELNQKDKCKFTSETKLIKKSKKYTNKINKKEIEISNVKKEDNRHICHICKKELANKGTLRNHMQMHNGYKFMCEHCARGFAVRAELKVHLVSVHGIGPYLQCDECDFKAPRTFDLTEHKRIHTGERPFACEVCGLTFRRRYKYRRHLAVHKGRNVECPHCPRKFYFREQMLEHSNSAHERRYFYVCSKCGVTYAKSGTVRKHMLVQHGIPKEAQGKITKVKKGTNEHLKDAIECSQNLNCNV